MQAVVTPAMHVLVVDDMEASREALCALVRELGHSVSSVEGGEAAVAWLFNHQPDAILLDLLMPGMDGFDACQRIRSVLAERWVPLIVISSLDGDPHFIEAVAHGADDYLARPVQPAFLDAKLRNYSRVLALQARMVALAQRQRDIQDNILDAVLTVDERGRVIDANLSACRVFADGAPDGLVGRTVQEATGLGLDGLLTRAAIEMRRADGQRFPAEVAASQWQEVGQVRTTLVVRDLTEQRRNERMRDEFLATVSHELRTPLTSVLGAVGLLAAGAAGPLPAAAMPLAAAARRSGERLSKLIDDILDLTKLEGDRLVLHLRPQLLAPLVRDAISANQGYADAARVSLRFSADDDAVAAATAVRVDADRFMQVLANLLSNAIKHSPAGEWVTVRLSLASTGVQVVVSDQGPGIDPAFQSRLFEKFSQADGSDRRAVGGTGLGLYISRLLVERMGGRIDAVQTPGSGASLRVWFERAGVGPQVQLPWVVHIERDAQARQQLSNWLVGLAQIKGVAVLDAAAVSALADRGCTMVLANPVGQGATDQFCAALRRLARGAPITLLGDSVNAEFAAAQGFSWLSAARADVTSLRAALRHALKNNRATADMTGNP